MISRALFYDMLDKAEVHSTYKELLASVKAPTKGLKTASRLVVERSKLYTCAPRGGKKLPLPHKNIVNDHCPSVAASSVFRPTINKQTNSKGVT